MNRSFCTRCGELAPSTTAPRDGKVYLVKDCPACGKTETPIASDARRYFAKRLLDSDPQQRSCGLECASCSHTGAHPSFAFVDVTNRCNMGCPICCDSVPSMGFTFNPPMEYFEDLFSRLAGMEPRPIVVLFGGEPTVREDLFDIIALCRNCGLKTRVATNGLKMADPAYCDRLLATRATILLSYDGARPETYLSLRGTASSLDLKRKAIENIGRSPGLRPGRVCFVTCIARGINDDEVSDLLEFCHGKRHFLSAVHFMPVAHVWRDRITGPDVELTTAEDIEELVDRAFPEDRVDFIPAGFVARFLQDSSLAERMEFPFRGTHPNCESVFLLLSDGKRYLPVTHYLRCTLTELAGDAMQLEKRLRGKRLRRGRLGGALLRLLLRRVRVGRLLKGWGPLKLGHAVALLARLAAGRGGRAALAAHTNLQGALLLLVAVPFEDDDIMETDRLARCPNVHVYIDPATDELRCVPVCAWRLFNRSILSAVAGVRAAHHSPALVSR